jgi:hypothetical protein
MASSKISSVIAEIRYYTNYSDPSAPVIQLGAIAEAATDKTRVLAMLGRAALTADELAPISGFNRTELEDVWAMLSKAFHAAWAQRPAFDGEGSDIKTGSMLKFLANTYSMALHFDPPRRFPMPKAIAERAERQPKSLSTSILRLLETRLKPAPKNKKVASPRGRRSSSQTRAISVQPRARFKESTNTEAVAQL